LKGTDVSAGELEDLYRHCARRGIPASRKTFARWKRVAVDEHVVRILAGDCLCHTDQ